MNISTNLHKFLLLRAVVALDLMGTQANIHTAHRAIGGDPTANFIVMVINNINNINKYIIIILFEYL